MSSGNTSTTRKWGSKGPRVNLQYQLARRAEMKAARKGGAKECGKCAYDLKHSRPIVKYLEDAASGVPKGERKGSARSKTAHDRSCP